MKFKRQFIVLSSVIVFIILLLVGTTVFTGTGEKEPSQGSPIVEKEKQVPILMYHHLAEEGYESNAMIVPPDKFKNDMVAINSAGYSTIHMKDLIHYVEGSADLPEKPILITFDDGYSSNYTYAYPILTDLNMKATISVIGWSVGRTEHRIKGLDFHPHFSWEEAKEMYDSGVIDIQNHSYDLHGGRTEERYGALPKEDESPEIYTNFFIDDTKKLTSLIEENVGNKVTTYTYPFGLFTPLTEQVLKDLGYQATLTVDEGMNLVKQGERASLFSLKRFNVDAHLSGEQLVQMLENRES